MALHTVSWWTINENWFMVIDIFGILCGNTKYRVAISHPVL